MPRPEQGRDWVGCRGVARCLWGDRMASATSSPKLASHSCPPHHTHPHRTQSPHNPPAARAGGRDAGREGPRGRDGARRRLGAADDAEKRGSDRGIRCGVMKPAGCGKQGEGRLVGQPGDCGKRDKKRHDQDSEKTDKKLKTFTGAEEKNTARRLWRRFSGRSSER